MLKRRTASKRIMKHRSLSTEGILARVVHDEKAKRDLITRAEKASQSHRLNPIKHLYGLGKWESLFWLSKIDFEGIKGALTILTTTTFPAMPIPTTIATKRQL